MRPQRHLKLLAAIGIVVIAATGTAQAQFGGGTGEPNTPYQIWTAEQMNAIGADPNVWDKHFILMADIDLSVYDGQEGRPAFNLIGTCPVDARGGIGSPTFGGVFDGNGHTLANFTSDSTDADYQGLFRFVSSASAEIKNLRLVAACVDAPTQDFVGALVGRLGRCTVTNCTVEDATVSGKNYVGGLVGRCAGGTITACHATGGSVEGNDRIGGLAGVFDSGTIEDSSADGTTVTGNNSIGGLAGSGSGWATGISRCYATATVIGNRGVGGLLGQGSATNCYATGAVTGNEHVGGLIGDGHETTNCYAACIVSGDAFVGGLVGGSSWGPTDDSFWDIEVSGQTSDMSGTGLTTAQMHTERPFRAWGEGDSSGIWTIDEGRDYPRLAWEERPGVPIMQFIDSVVGTGTADDPYLIWTAKQLLRMSWSPDLWDKHFKLIADIDLDPSLPDGKVFQKAVIAPDVGGYHGFEGPYFEGPGFAGVFDGNDHTISHLTIEGTDFLGLFGKLDAAAIVTDLYLEAIDINGTGWYVGGLASLNNGSVHACHVSGIVNGSWYVGGLAGENQSCITASSSDAGVGGEWDVGGLVGRNFFGRIAACWSTGMAQGGGDIGGLVGDNSVHSGIVNSYSTGVVDGSYDVGGLMGSNGGHVATSYSTGPVSGVYDIGGFVGHDFHERVDSATTFWDMETSGQVASAGGTGLTTAEMQDSAVFLAGGWDLANEIDNGTSDYWQTAPGAYPRLRCQAGEELVMPEGAGTVEQPYLIRDALDLGTVWLDPMAQYRLESSVDLSGTAWSMAVVPWFAGVFEGNGYVISNLHIRGDGYLGLFGELGLGTEVCDLGLEAVDVNGVGSSIGALAGRIYGARITACHTDGVIWGTGRDAGTGYAIGGLVGDNEEGVISASHNACAVSGMRYVGGLVGYNHGVNASLIASHNTGAISGISNNIGGLTGDNHGSITACHNNGAITGDWSIGGLVGFNWSGVIASSNRGAVSGRGAGGIAAYNAGSITACYNNGEISGGSVGGLVRSNGSSGSITVCYSSGPVTGDSEVGGLLANNGSYKDEAIRACFWDVETSGQVNMCGYQGAGHTGCDDSLGRTTAEMQTASTFLDAGWDFIGESDNGTEDIWWMPQQDYPRLWWELGIDD